MQEDALIQNHVKEAERDLRGAAEDKGINDPRVGGKFPDKKETKQDQYPGYADDPLMFAVHQQIFLLFV